MKKLASLVSILTAGAIFTTVHSAEAHEVDKAKEETVKNFSNFSDFDNRFHDLDEKRKLTAQEIDEREKLVEQYQKDIEELKTEQKDLLAERDKIVSDKENVEEQIKENEEKRDNLEQELINLNNEKVVLENEKEDKVNLLKDRLNTYYKNDAVNSDINMFEEGATINDILVSYNQLEDIAESDKDAIVELIEIVEELEAKVKEIEGKVVSLEELISNLDKDYNALVELEVKNKLLENELKIKYTSVDELLTSEELSLDALHVKLSGIEVEEESVMNELGQHRDSISLEEYKDFMDGYASEITKTKEELEKTEKRLSDLLERKSEADKLVQEYRDKLYELKEFNEDLIVDREKELEELQSIQDKTGKEYDSAQEDYSKLSKQKSDKKEELTQLKKEMKELEGKLKESTINYQDLVFDKSILEDIDNDSKKVEKIEEELKQIEIEFQKTKLADTDYDLIKELESNVSKFESQISIVSGEGMIRPTYGKKTYGYGSRSLLKGESFHYGVDIANSTGTPIYSVMDGVVVGSAFNEKVGYGHYIIVEHNVGGKTYTTLYGHMSKRGVKVGDTVKQGEVIGLMGSTGWSTGPHLHFEVYNGKKNGWGFGNVVEPMTFFKDSNFSKANLMSGK